MDKELMEQIAKDFIKKIDNQSEIDLGYNGRRWLIRNLADLLKVEAQAGRYKVIEEIRKVVDGCDDTRAMEKAITDYITDNEEVHE